MSTGKILIIAILAAILPALSHAIDVGPLDGKAGPKLTPISTPSIMAIEELPDTGFPKELESMGDLTGAAMEWERLAYKGHGAEREQALTNATRLHIALGQPAVAVTLLTQLLTENSASSYAPEALYHIATGPSSPAQTNALTQLKDKFTGNPWANAALLNDVWQQAEHGKIMETYKIPEAETLKKRMKLVRLEQQERVAKAAAFGVIVPGAGHAYAGNIGQGATVLIIFCLFALAFLSACRHRHYAYSFLFIIPAAALWLTSPVVAMQLVKDDSQKILTAKLGQWKDLRPMTPTEKAAMPHS